MPYQPLPNYLRAHRKRLELSQGDLAYLLGCGSGAKVSRYEHFRRQPNLSSVFAFEVIIGVAARQLFVASYVDAKRDVVRRARRLLRSLAGQPETPRLRRRIMTLRAILSGIICRTERT